MSSDLFDGPTQYAGAEFRPGRRIGQFELESPLGRGGMGQIWKARDVDGNRDVALKFLPPEFRGNADAMDQVRAAFQVVHALHHQHICPIHTLSSDPAAGPYLVIGYVPGVTLSEYRRLYVARHGSFPVEQAVRVLMPVAEALDYAHAKGVIHRDVKPQNVLIVHDDLVVRDVQLIDFGLAAEIRSSLTRHTNARSRDTAGTLAYMAPEQCRGKRREQDGRTDQYSLAVVAYGLLAGYLPFEADDEFALIHAILQEEPEPIPELRPEENSILLKALAKPKGSRFDQCGQFLRQMGDTSSGVGFSPPIPSIPVSQGEQPFLKPASTRQVVASGSDSKRSAVETDAEILGKARASFAECERRLSAGISPVDYLKEVATDRFWLWMKLATPPAPEVMMLVASCYRHGVVAFQNSVEAVKMFRRCAELGNAAAMNSVGTSFETGSGVKQDRAEAIKWYRQAASLGYAVAMNNLGLAYFYGNGVTQDREEGLRWYTEAAKRGCGIAMNNLGVAYSGPDSTADDYVRAVSWYRKAAELGCPIAINNLGLAFDSGHGVPVDHVEAFKCYRAAADLGCSTAMMNLGYCYEEGHGVSGPDFEMALQSYRRAADCGNPEGEAAVSRLKGTSGWLQRLFRNSSPAGTQ